MNAVHQSNLEKSGDRRRLVSVFSAGCGVGECWDRLCGEPTEGVKYTKLVGVPNDIRKGAGRIHVCCQRLTYVREGVFGRYLARFLGSFLEAGDVARVDRLATEHEAGLLAGLLLLSPPAMFQHGKVLVSLGAFIVRPPLGESFLVLVCPAWS